MNVESLTKIQILAIPVDQPERLFTGEEAVAKLEYRILAGKWHPDHKTGSGEVFAHINVLYHLAVDKIADGVWKIPGLLQVTDLKGRVYRMRYRVTRPFELGEIYIGNSMVAYTIKKDYTDLVDSASRLLQNFKFPDAEQKAQVSKWLPKWHDSHELPDRYLVVVQKEPDMLCLRDLANHFGGTIAPRHVAWIMSRLHSMLIYLQWSGIMHNDISPDTFFISPAGHIGSLVGGWWYACRSGQKMRALPERTMRFALPDAIKKKTADFRIDSELIRAVGRELLGDPTGSKLCMMKDVPEQMANWLRSPPGGRALDDYTLWYDKILPKAFGPRRYVRMEVDGDIYEGK